MAIPYYGSGGGFSTQFNASSYQAAAVAGYLKQAHTLHKFPPNGTFSTYGRATPDVSGVGITYDLIYDYFHNQVGGPACASTVVSDDIVACGFSFPSLSPFFLL